MLLSSLVLLVDGPRFHPSEKAMPVGGCSLTEVEAPPGSLFRVSIYVCVSVTWKVLAVQNRLGLLYRLLGLFRWRS